MVSFTLSSPEAIARQIATRLRDRRLARRWTRRELAERSGIPSPTIRKFEATGHIALERLVQLAIVLDASRELEGLFARRPVLSLDELEPVAKRQRGRASNKSASSEQA